MDNLKYYNMSRSVPKEAQKEFSNGRFSGTDINPMWRIKMLTEMFGPAGVGWYVDDVVERCEIHGETTISIVNIKLYVKIDGEWSKPIYGTGGNTLLRKGVASDEGYKMAYTDALSVACKALGIGADIWYANDKTKYTAGEQESKEKKEEKIPELMTNCSECKGVITPWIKDGTTKMTQKQVAEASINEFGVPLCLDCIRKRKASRANQ